MNQDQSKTDGPAPVSSTPLLGRPRALGPNRRNRGAVTCLTCLAWPEVLQLKSAVGIWMAWCLRCDRSVTADSREEVIKGWNQKNERLQII